MQAIPQRVVYLKVTTISRKARQQPGSLCIPRTLNFPGSYYVARELGEHRPFEVAR